MSPLPVALAALLPLPGAGFGAAAGLPGPSQTANADLEREAVHHLFNLDFDLADAAYERLEVGRTDHPIGPYNRAAIIWTRLARESGVTRGGSMRSDRYWSQSRRQHVEPEEEARFLDFLEEARSRSDRMLEGDEDDLEGLYYRGASEALRAGWDVIVRRAYFGSFRAVRRAARAHRRVIELDPDFADAYVVPGAYDYGLAAAPRVLRILTFLMGERGDRERGLAFVARTAEDGDRARWGALWTHALFMRREGREAEALQAVRALQREFPRNPDYVIEEAGILLARGEFAASRRVVERFLDRRDLGFGNYRLAGAGVPELHLGEALLFEERWEEAGRALSRGLEVEAAPETQAFLHFRRGNARDGAGDREAALGDYRRVRSLKADKVLESWARRLEKTPWPDGAPPGALPGGADATEDR